MFPVFTQVAQSGNICIYHSQFMRIDVSLFYMWKVVIWTGWKPPSERAITTSAQGKPLSVCNPQMPIHHPSRPFSPWNPRLNTNEHRGSFLGDFREAWVGLSRSIPTFLVWFWVHGETPRPGGFRTQGWGVALPAPAEPLTVPGTTKSETMLASWTPEKVSFFIWEMLMY